MSDQQSLRSACAYVQSDQSLCWSLEYPMSVKLLSEHRLEFLSLKGDYTCQNAILVEITCFSSYIIRGAFGKFLTWSFISVTDLQTLSCLVLF